jgi:hypothetical protein
MFCKATRGAAGGGASLKHEGGLCGAAGSSRTTLRRSKGEHTRAGGFIRAISDPGGALRDE